MITRSIQRSSSLLLLLTLLASRAFPAPLDVDGTHAVRPLHFEPNQGQARDDVKFLSRGQGYGVYLTANEALLVLSPPASADRGSCAANDVARRVLRMSLRHSEKTPAVRGTEEQLGKANYFTGADASKWRTNIPTYARVRYSEVYPGIDLVYYGNERQLEYDFVLAPGADPRKIELQFDGADRVEIDANGDLVLHACGREIRQPKPVVYQEANGRRELTGGYVRTGKNRIGFEVAAYDRSLPLVIDPMVLTYGTYLGGPGSDWGSAIAVDAHGAAYVTGSAGYGLPTTAGAYQTTFGGGGGGEFGEIIPEDAFVTKFNADGSLAYLTYLGTRGNESGRGIAVDSEGAAYVVGDTDSPSTFPTTPGAFLESSYPFPPTGSHVMVFATKLDPTGSALAYSTLINDGRFASDIAVDPTGDAYIAAEFYRPFQTTPNAFQYPDARLFVVKLNATGSALVYSSGFGPASESSRVSIALDGGENAYVTGTTSSSSFPATSGAFQTALRGYRDVFVTKLGPVGELIYSTYLGGSADGAYDSASGVAVDTGGNAYVTGYTSSTDFPTTPGVYRTTPGSGFVTKLNPSGSGLVYSTYLGGSGADIGVDARGRAYVGHGEDYFVTAVDPSGSAVSVSGIGGGSTGGVAGIALDAAGKNVWVTGVAGANFPATPNAYQPHFVQGAQSYYGDAFVAKIATYANSVPGTLEAEDFDQGGEGPAYHDNTPGNQGDAGYRTGEDVDIFVSNDAAGGGRIVKNFESGEWLAYTINVQTSGNYDVELRASTHPAFPSSSYYVVIDDVNVTGTIVLPDTGGWDNYQWIGKTTIALNAGQHLLKIVSVTPYFGLNSIRLTLAAALTPYYGTPTAVPGEFEAEAFDFGGEGAAYHDNAPGNQGDSGLRTGEDVDIFISNDAGSGSPYIVKNFEAGEWLDYSISVANGGNYDIELRAATNAAFPDSAYHVEIDGTNVTGTVVLPDTGGWDNYQWIGRRTIALAAGTHVLKLVSERPYFGLNSIRLTATGSVGATPTAIPGVIEAEQFDAGGEGPGYHENTAGNQGDAGYRTSEDVDIFSSNDGGSGSWYIIKNFEAGEWLAYTISVPTTGNYDLELRASTSSDFPNRSYYAQIDGANVTGVVALPDTGGWDNYQWIGKKTIALTAGAHVLKVVAYQPYFGFNSLRVLHSSP